MTYSLVSSSYATYSALLAAKPTYLEIITVTIDGSLTATAALSNTASIETAGPTLGGVGDLVSTADLTLPTSAALVSSPVLRSGYHQTYAELLPDTYETAYQSNYATGYPTYQDIITDVAFYSGFAPIATTSSASSAGGSISADAVVTQFSSSTSSATGTSAADGLVEVVGATALPSGVPALTASSVASVTVDAALVGSGEVVSGPAVSMTAASTTSATASVTPDGQVTALTSASLSSTPSSSAVMDSAVGSAIPLSATAGLAAGIDLTLPTDAALSAGMSGSDTTVRDARTDSASTTTPALFFTLITLYSDLDAQVASYSQVLAEFATYDHIRAFGERWSSPTDPIVVSADLVADAGITKVSTATLDGSGTLTSDPSLPLASDANLSATAAVVSTELVTRPLDGVLASTATLTPTELLNLRTDAALSATADVVSDVAVTALTSVALSAVAELATASIRSYSELPSAYIDYADMLNEVADYTALAQGLIFDSATDIPAATGTLTADLIKVFLADSASSFTPTVTGDIDLSMSSSSALPAAAGSLSADGLVERYSDAVFSAGGTLSAGAGAAIPASAELSVTAVLRTLAVMDYAELLPDTYDQPYQSNYATGYPTYQALITDVYTYQQLLAAFQSRSADSATTLTAAIAADAAVVTASSAGLTAVPSLLVDGDHVVPISADLSATAGSLSDTTRVALTTAGLTTSGLIRTTVADDYAEVVAGYPTYAELAAEVISYQALTTIYVTHETSADLTAPGGDLLADGAAEYVTDATLVAANFAVRSSVIERYDQVPTAFPAYSYVLLAIPEYSWLSVDSGVVHAIDSSLAVVADLVTDSRADTVGSALLSASATVRSGQIDDFDDLLAGFPTYFDLVESVATYSILENNSGIIHGDSVELTAAGDLAGDSALSLPVSAALTSSAVLRTSLPSTYSEVSTTYTDYSDLLAEVLEYSWLSTDSGIVHAADALLESVFGEAGVAGSRDITASAAFSATPGSITGRPDDYQELEITYPSYDRLSTDVLEYFWLDRNSGITLAIDAALESGSLLDSASANSLLADSSTTISAALRTGYHQTYSEVQAAYPTYAEVSSDLALYSWLTINTTMVSIDAALSATGTSRVANVTNYIYGMVAYPTYSEMLSDVAEYSWFAEGSFASITIQADLTASSGLTSLSEQPETYARLGFIFSDYTEILTYVADYAWFLPLPPDPAPDPEPPGLTYWDGIQKDSGTLRYYDGSGWVSSGMLKHWDGSQWISI